MIKNLTTALFKLGAVTGLAAAFAFSGAAHAAGEANGKSLYNTRAGTDGKFCFTCHNDPTLGISKIKNGANNPGTILSAINNNTSGMGVFIGKFTTAELTDIAAYIFNPAAATSAPAISLSATTLSFTNVTVASTSAAQSATLTNSGSAALNFTGLSITGINANEYTLGGTCAVGTPVAAAGKCTLTATFTPTVVGTRTAAISIASDAAATSIVLSGTSIAAPPPPAPVATLSTATVSFGSQQINTTSAAQTVTLSNTGNAAMTGIAVTLPAGAFAIASNACGATLAAGANCAIGLAFKPITAVASTATLSVASNGSATPKTAALSGTGTAAASPTATLTPATYDGGSVLVGASSAVGTSTFTNQGPGVIAITGVNTTGTGADAASFVVGGTCTAGSSVAAGSACTVTTQFKPTGIAGIKTASVAIASNASGSYAVALTGTATVPAVPGISVSPATGINFATTAVGSVAAAPLTITNSGTGMLNVSAITSSNTIFNVAASASAKACAAGMTFDLAPAATCEVAIEFKPSTAGPAQGAIAITSNAVAPPPVPVSGVAEVASPPPPSGGTGGGTVTAGATNVGGGGCTIGTTNTPFDPLLILMAGISLVLIVRRQLKR